MSPSALLPMISVVLPLVLRSDTYFQVSFVQQCLLCCDSLVLRPRTITPQKNIATGTCSDWSLLNLRVPVTSQHSPMSLLLAQGGRIGIIGVYVGYTNHFNIGGFMEKSMAAAGGQVRHLEPNPAAGRSESITMLCQEMLHASCLERAPAAEYQLPS